MKMAVFWVVAPCGLVWVYRRFRGPYCLHHHGNESSPSWWTSESSDPGATATSLKSYQSTRRSNPEDSHVSTHSTEQWLYLHGGLLYSIMKLELLAAASRTSWHLICVTQSSLADELNKHNNAASVTVVEIREHEQLMVFQTQNYNKVQCYSLSPVHAQHEK
jgi:hypothetical protein